MTFNAIYENGVIKPLLPLSLKEGTHLQVTVEDHRRPLPPRRVAELLDEIAALPLQNSSEFSGEDHDKVLYGDPPA